MQACEVTDLTTPEITRTALYTSHEALLLGFEQAMTRSIRPRAAGTTRARISCGSATVPASSTGRTSSSAARSPTPGRQAGPSMAVDDLRRLCDALNPANEPGRLTVISRMGHEQVERHLPP